MLMLSIVLTGCESVPRRNTEPFGKVYYLDEEKAAEGEDTSQWDDHRLRIPPESN